VVDSDFRKKMAPKKQKDNEPAPPKTFQAVLLADVSQGFVFSALNAGGEGGEHALLLPVLGVPLVDFFLRTLTEYNGYAASERQGECALTELFVVTRCKQLRKHVDSWARLNLTNRLSIKTIAPAPAQERAAGAGATSSCSADNNEDSTRCSLPANPSGPEALRELKMKGLLGGEDFLLVEPDVAWEKPADLYSVLSFHRDVRKKNKETLLTKVFADSKFKNAEEGECVLDRCTMLLGKETYTANLLPLPASGGAGGAGRAGGAEAAGGSGSAVKAAEKEERTAKEILSFSQDMEKRTPDFNTCLVDFCKAGGELEFVKGMHDGHMYVCAPDALTVLSENQDLVYWTFWTTTVSHVNHSCYALRSEIFVVSLSHLRTVYETSSSTGG